MKSFVTFTTLAAALLAAAPASAQFGRDSNAPVDITADVSEYTNNQCTSVWRGDAEVLQGDARLRADVLTISFRIKAGELPKPGSGDVGSDCGELTRVEARGAVYYLTPGQRVRGDAAVYDARNETIVMTGEVVATDGLNVLVGSRMVFNLDTGEGQLVGTGTGLGQPGRPRGIFFPERPAEDLAQ